MSDFKTSLEESLLFSESSVYGLFKVINYVSNKKLSTDDHCAVLWTHLTGHYLQNIYLGYGSFLSRSDITFPLYIACDRHISLIINVGK